jgi:hypothetical protein
MNDLGPEEVINAVLEVRDPGKQASEYSFLDEIEQIHPAPARKGNDGLANWIADLAIFRVEDHIVIDEDLIEEADEILRQQHDTGYERSRIENIVINSEKRPGSKKSLVDNRVDGHERLLEMVQDFYRETAREKELENLYKNSDLSLDCDNMAGGNVFGIDPATGLKVAVDALDEYLSDEASDYTVIPVHEEDSSFSSKPENLDESKGGENMTEYDHSRRTLAGTIAKHDEATSEMVHGVARLERELGTASALEAVVDELEENAIGDHRSVQSYLDSQMDTDYEFIDNVIDQAYNELSSVDVPDAPSDASARALDDATGYNGR